VPIIYTRKRKARVIKDVEGEDKVEELEETAGGEQKQARCEETGLLVFNGLVSLSRVIFILTKLLVVRSMHLPQGRATMRHQEGCGEVHPMHKKCLGMLVGRGLEERDPTGGPEEGEVGGREVGNTSKHRYKIIRGLSGHTN
jgi:hypothetical protein